MNLSKLFPIQKKLDDRIVKEKGLEGQDLLDKKILALQVELGELANEWRGFKFWSENREPNIIHCHACNGYGYFDSTYQEGCGYCHTTGIQENPLLEEYVDCLHFILSIGNELGEYEYAANKGREHPTELVDVFNSLFEIVAEVKYSIKHKNLTAHGTRVAINNYEVLIGAFTQLGEILGFTWEQIEQAYFDKNKVNHERQENGY